MTPIRRIAWSAAAGLVAATTLVAVLFAYLFAWVPAALPPLACGSQHADFALHCPGGLPLLIENGLAYPTAFDWTSHPAQSLNGTWAFRLDPAERGDTERWWQASADNAIWQPIEVPSTPDAFRGPHRDYDGVSWYRLRFRARAPEGVDTAALQPVLAFDGVLLRAEVWLNGRRLGAHEGGYSPFYLDASDALGTAEENRLVVRVDDRLRYDSLPARLSPRYRAGWAVYGGITRDVRLEWWPPNRIVKALVRSTLPGDRGSKQSDKQSGNQGDHRRDDQGGDQVALRIEVLARAGGARVPELTISIEAPDASRRTSGPLRADTVEQGYAHYALDLTLAHPDLYASGHAALYTLTLDLRDASRSVHRVRLRTGLRSVRTDETGLRLNGEPLFLRGISKHEDDPTLGATQTAASIERDLSLVTALRANYIRLAHYPHALAELHAVRDRALFVSEEIPFYQIGNGFLAWIVEKQAWRAFPLRQFGLHQLADPLLQTRAQRQLAEMIERDINNPAVLFWSVGNETFSWTPGAGAVHASLAASARFLDSTRPVTMAEITTGVPALDDHRHAGDAMDLLSYNVYAGWYYGQAADLETILLRAHRVHPQRPIVLSEFGAGAARGRSDADGVFRANRVQPHRTYSEGYQARVVATAMEIAHRLPFVTGVSPWVFADFFCPWFPDNPVPDYNVKGFLSRDREPKEVYRETARRYAKWAASDADADTD